MKKIVILVSCILSFSVKAEFENTKWGMNLFDLRMMYQSGHSRVSNDGIVEYITPANFKNYPDSFVSFIFTKDRLNSTIIDLGNKYSNVQCQEILNNLITQYTVELGSPDYQDDSIHAWNFKSGGSVMLTSLTKKSGCAPWVIYFNKPIVVNGKFCDPRSEIEKCN
jgi:hypothetical protein